MNSDPAKENRVAAVRRFNRFYTREIGVLKDGYLGTPYSLTEGRVLYELAHRKNPHRQSHRERRLRRPRSRSRLPKPHRSPIQEISPRPHRSLPIRRPRNPPLSTPRGRQAMAQLNTRSNKEVAARLRPIPEPEKARLVTAMQTIEQLLAPQNNGKRRFCAVWTKCG